MAADKERLDSLEDELGALYRIRMVEQPCPRRSNAPEALPNAGRS